MRKYVILQQDGYGLWVKVTTVEATSSDQAIRNVANDEGVYVAIPDRNFQPVKVSVLQPKPRIVLRDDESEPSADG